MENHKRGSPKLDFDASNSGKSADASVFYWFMLLPSKIIKVVSKAIAMIVIPRSA